MVKEKENLSFIFTWVLYESYLLAIVCAVKLARHPSRDKTANSQVQITIHKKITTKTKLFIINF